VCGNGYLLDMGPLLVVLLIGATARVTRLATTDAIFETPRSAIERRLPEKLAYLIRCDWCASVWAGFAVFLFGWYAPDTMVLIVSGALTASLVTGWLHSFAQLVDAKLWDADDSQ
jgi:divalent metal cation (Fe/Co/Zn/Cd) transporter